MARDVVDPERGVSIRERLRARQEVNATNAEERKEIRERELIRIDALGSGSDYTAFLQHVGIAALNIGYGGESGGGSYHSIYDSFDHYTRFIDPKFDYGIAQAETTGRLTLRLRKLLDVILERLDLAPQSVDLLLRRRALRIFRWACRRLQLEPQPAVRIRPGKGKRTDGAQP